MKKRIFIIAAIALIVIVGGSVTYILFKNKTSSAANASSDKSHLVEIFYLPHQPALDVLHKVEPILQNFPQFQVKEYNFLDNKNVPLIEKYGIAEHMPIAIFIGGKDEFNINGKDVVFKNFPEGDAFVPEYTGDWSYDDLQQELASFGYQAAGASPY